MFKLAHVADLHIGPLPPVALGDLLNKRLLGYVSWRTRRMRAHRREVLDALCRDLHESRPDHVVVSGDLVNIALPAEFHQAADWLRALGPPEWITVVPGNHDAYVPLPRQQSWDHWAAYMTGDDAGEDRPLRFPFLRRRPPLAIIGLSTAVPSPPTFATGELGHLQLAALDSLLQQLADNGLCRVIVLHHPPLDGVISSRKRLTDAAAFRAVIARRGADLILHGHTHRSECGQITHDGGTVPVVGVPSASELSDPGEAHGGYHIYGIERQPDGWWISIEHRQYDGEAGRFVTCSRRLLDTDAAAALPLTTDPADACRAC